MAKKPSFLDRFKKNFKGNFSQLIDPTVGAAKGALSTISGASELGQRGLRSITSPLTGAKPDIAAIPKQFTTPTNTAQRVGFGAEQLAEFLIPASKAVQAEKAIASGIKASQLPRSLQKGLSLGSRVGTGAATFGGVSAVQSGELGEEAKAGALIGGAFPIAGAGLGALGRGLGRTTGFASKQVAKTKAGQNFLTKSQRFLDKARTKVQDSFLPVRRAVQKAKGPVAEKADIGLAETLYSGRTGAKLTAFEEESIRPVLQGIHERAQKAAQQMRNSAATLRKQPGVVVPNAAANAQALEKGATALEKNPQSLVNEYLQMLHAPERNAILGDGAAGVTTREATQRLAQMRQLPGFQEIKVAADEVGALARDLPKFLLDNELITRSTFQALENNYKNYVPLQRIIPEELNFSQALGGKSGFNIRGKEFFKAKGSDKPVADIMESTVINWQNAIGRAEKNKVAKSVLEFARQHPETGVFQVLEEAPAKIGGRRLFSAKEGGVEKFIEVFDDDVFKSLKGLGTENAGIVAKAFGPMTRFISAINTSYNPEFLVSNFTRDLQSAGLNLSAELGPDVARKTVMNIPRGQKGVFDFLKGKDTAGSRLYKELVNEGGTTQFFQFGKREEVGKVIQKMQKEFSTGAIGKAIKSPKKILDGLNMLNDVVENGVRLSTYEQGLSAGLTKKRAAELAKEVTVNFNKKGEAGSMFNSLFAFANASIQGSFRTFRALSDPEKATKLIALIEAPTIAINSWNDKVNPEGYAKIPDYEKASNFVVMTGDGDDSYVKIPLPWGWNVFKIAGDNVYNQAKGRQGTTETLAAAAGAFANAYNPIGGQSISEIPVPTALRPWQAIFTNKAWHGGAIQPKQFTDTKDSLNFFDSTNPIFVNIAESFSEATGGRGAKEGFIEVSPESLEYLWGQYTGGSGRFVERSSNVISKVAAGDPVSVNTIPFVRRFLGKVDDERANNNIIFSILGDSRKEVLPAEKRATLKDILGKEIETGRTSVKKAETKLKDFDREQRKLADIEVVVDKFAIENMDDETYERFRKKLTDKNFAKAQGFKKDFTKTQLKILDTFR